ncbi:MAG: hypothetical protein K2Y01_02715 [Rhabdochlamydiaceae bacterium]|nr:hypothetical protein [Rhabdochlamydiaceae bacterium]
MFVGYGLNSPALRAVVYGPLRKPSLNGFSKARHLSMFSAQKNIWGGGRVLKDSPIHSRKLASVFLTPKEDASIAAHWNYPSDHLPALGSILGVRVGTFNILNSAYVHHVIRDCWKTSHFMIQEKIASQMYEGLSLREQECYQSIQALMLNGSKSLDVLCIQECSDKMFMFLRREFSKLKSSNEIQLFMVDGGMGNHVVMLVKPSLSLKVTASFGKALWSRKFVPPETKSLENPRGVEQFALDVWRPASVVEIEKVTSSGKIEKIVLVGVHVSCAGEQDEYRIDRANELAAGVRELSDPNKTLVTLGDFNMSGCVTSKSDLNILKDLTPGYRHVDAKIPEAMAIDRIFADVDEYRKDFCGPVFLDESSDVRAAEVYKNTLYPILFT